MLDVTLQPLKLNPALNVVLVSDGAGLDNMVQDLYKGERIIGWDTETNPLKDYFHRKQRLMQFGRKDIQYVVDLLAFCDNSDQLSKGQGYYGTVLPRGLEYVKSKVSPILCSTDFLKVGVNLAFEYENSYWGFGMRTYNFFSCDMVERVIVAGSHSLKDYAYFSMAEMMARYFGVEVLKDLQMSFDVDSVLSKEQIEYAALDTRLPLALRQKQLLSVKPDGLEEVCKIENDAIGGFIDMHVHGFRTNRENWAKRNERFRANLADTIKELDNHFLPLVGSKSVIITDEDIEAAKAKWKVQKEVTEEELQLKKQIKTTKDPDLFFSLTAQKEKLEAARKVKKEILKKEASELGKKRTKLKNLAAECEGEALINYGSNAQILKVLQTIKKFEKLEDTNDDSLVKFKNEPIIQVIRKYRELSKQVDTYGNSWILEWATKPCNEEGWLHPSDGRLHPKFNQLEAETGRSSSSQPNAQNLPQDKEVRAFFEADPPDEDEPEGYVIVTADMSGAELRIIAERAGAQSWIDAFARGEDVHSVGTEIMYPDEWPKHTIHSILHPDSWTLEDVKTERIEILVGDKVKKLPPCAYFARKSNGEYARQKCDCPEHKRLRDGNKSTNFLLAYGGTSYTLAERLFITQEEAQALMDLHRSKFPDIWNYLEKAGKEARYNFVAFDMFGRRRKFQQPTYVLAEEKYMLYREEKLRYPEKAAEKLIFDFKNLHGRDPEGKLDEPGTEYYLLTHRKPTFNEVQYQKTRMLESIERQGKNHGIQGTNASIAKLAMGAGYDSIQNKPYLWHILPKYKAKMLGFVHDELIVQCPKRFAEQVAFEIGDAFKRAAAEKMTRVVMEFDYHIASHWLK